MPGVVRCRSERETVAAAVSQSASVPAKRRPRPCDSQHWITRRRALVRSPAQCPAEPRMLHRGRPRSGRGVAEVQDADRWRRRAGDPLPRPPAHTNASLALGAGVAMKTVSERLVHSSTTITADLYTHVSPIVARDAAQRIAGAIPTPAQRASMTKTRWSSNGLANPTSGPPQGRGL